MCVVAVLVYHQPARWLPGGFLAVSTFFTLSGFLIGRLLLGELRATGTIRLARFAGRRLRRLAPAALVVALTAVVVWAVTNRSLPSGDLPAAIGYGANWWLLHVGHGYSQLFRVASPVQHYWSLAIEEQFYLAFPLVALGLFRLGRRGLGGLRIGIGALTVTGFALSAVVGADTAYYATYTRAAEILLGAFLATMVASRRGERAVRTIAERPGFAVIGPLALVGLVSLWATATIGSTWLFPWATAANALLSAIVIVECVYGRHLRRLLSVRPATALGEISYALYLVHWPIFLVLTPSSGGIPLPALWSIRLVVSISAAIVLHLLVEEPVRAGRRFRQKAFPVLVGGLATATLVLAVVAVRPPRSAAIDERAIAAERDALLALPLADAPSATDGTPSHDAAEATSVAEPAAASGSRPPAPGPATAAPGALVPSTAASAGSSSVPSSPVPSSPATTAPPESLQRVLFVGDSTSWSLSLGVTDAMGAVGVDVRAFPAVGCGLGGATPIRYLNQPEAVSEACQTWFEQLPDVVERFRPQVVVVVGGVADLSDRRLPSGDWAHIGEPAYDDWLSARMQSVVGTLSASGARVAWLTLPHEAVQPNPGFTGPPPFAENDPARADRYDQLIAQLAASDARVTLVDFAGYLRQRPGGEFAAGLRPDGVHIDSRQFADIRDYLVTAVTALGPELTP